MAFNINNFISNLGRDGLRPNLFEIILPTVSGAPNATFALKAKATALPASSVGVAPLFYFGRQAKFAGNRVFADWTVSVIMDETDFLPGGAKGQLEQWSGLLNSHIGNIRNPGYVPPQVYMKNGTVLQYGKAGDVVGTYQMTGCFPIDVGAIPVDWGANDQIAEFTVTFAMQYWTSISSVN